MQLCKNAQFYNEDQSLIHEDSIVLQRVFQDALKQMLRPGPRPLEEPGADDSNSKGMHATYYFEVYIYCIKLMLGFLFLTSR